jgi:hypothetical protein
MVWNETHRVPEITVVTKKVYIWSLGMIGFEHSHGSLKPPLPFNFERWYDAVEQSLVAPKDADPTISPFIDFLCSCMLRRSPGERSMAKEC